MQVILIMENAEVSLRACFVLVVLYKRLGWFCSSACLSCTGGEGKIWRLISLNVLTFSYNSNLATLHGIWENV